MKNNLLAWSFISLFFCVGCAEDYKFVNQTIPPKPFEPDQPIVVSIIEPDSGVYNTQFVISGKNFGTDLSRIKVYFGEKDTARLISTNGDCIYGLTPRQEDGQNKVSVVVDSKYKGELSPLFKYTRMEQITTIAGVGNTNTNKDGTLADAAFKVIRGMCMVADDNLLVSTDVPNMRFVSEKENTVITISTGIKFGSPCATKDREKAYAIQYDGVHSLYVFTRAKGWQSTKLLSTLGDQIKGRVAGCALDDNDRFLYFCDTNGMFAKIDLETYEVIVLNESIGDMGGTNTWCFIERDKFNDCYYVTAQQRFKVYKVSPDGKEVETYLGEGGQGWRDGKREDALFNTLTGLTIDNDGVLYLVDTGNGVIRSLKDDIVTTIAGRHGVLDILDGKPLEAKLAWPYEIDVDSQGSLYFIECNRGLIRKFTIQ